MAQTVGRVVDERVLADFLATAVEVLRDATGAEAVVEFEARDASRETIVVMIRARGDLSGVTWSFPVMLVREVASRMVGDMEIDRALIDAAATELANILMGRAAHTLELHGLRLDMGVPELGCLHSAPGIWATLATPSGSVAVVFHPPEPA